MTPPTLEQVLLHAAKIGLVPVEAERAFAYYESNGWRVGRNPMKNWQMALTGWKLRCQCESDRRAQPLKPPGQYNAVDKMGFMHELKLIEGMLKSLENSYSEMQSWDPADRARRKQLRIRKAELHRLLGFQV